MIPEEEKTLNKKYASESTENLTNKIAVYHKNITTLTATNETLRKKLRN